MEQFDRVKTEAFLSAVIAINFAMVRQIARMSPEPGEAIAWMQAISLRFLSDSAEFLPPPADAIARHLVETVFLQ